MDYAIQLLLPIMGGLLLGYWLNQRFGADPIWTVILAILGMVGGIGILYKRFTYPELYAQSDKEAHQKTKPKASKISGQKPGKAPPGSTSEKKTALPIEHLDFLYREPDEKDDLEHPYRDEDDPGQP